jgi:hypothetical protein
VLKSAAVKTSFSEVNQMYCPNCGHQPSSAAPRFCSGCGLRLDGVAQLIEAGGALEALAPPAASAPPSPRRQGLRLGAKLMFASLVLLPFCFGLSFPADSPAPLLIPLTVFFVGLSWSLYARLFRDDAPAPPFFERVPPALGAPTPEAAGFADRRQPPSVVDSTTKLLSRK